MHSLTYARTLSRNCAAAACSLSQSTTFVAGRDWSAFLSPRRWSSRWTVTGPPRSFPLPPEARSFCAALDVVSLGYSRERMWCRNVARTVTSVSE
ncbi:uncharacterized protein LAESUDRAFT_316248 [Laetiporus sulphureus 93-53]|uniref:Uncharacterized protein n=1 Tax=Laetiporus sulphureus 93-53 TaxID=1314785 RepID=A0A165D2Q4_9APHY|nr:uncharacterized protein LAESUDRAFT_316248 [Laetiporus sulphureus 93-53]KZT04039.1 hypothetical protein LAESUDRAFT_316248 [Laetiporus sulphureus 93-53]